MRTFFVGLFVSIVALGTAAAQDVQFTVDLRNTASKTVKVSIEMKQSGAETVTYQMPAWAPGAYAMTNFGRYVENFRAYGYSGDEKPVTRINDNRWHIGHGKDIKRIEYEVRDSHKDTTSLYYALAHIDTSFFFANATALFGYINDDKSYDVSVKYLVPDGWDLECSADPWQEKTTRKVTSGRGKRKRHRTITTKTDVKNGFIFSSYDELADAPVMAGKGFQRRSFTITKRTYNIVVASDKPFPMDSLLHLTKQIVFAHISFFNDQPYKRYSFLINAPTFRKLPTMNTGALEHANSSAYLLVNMPWQDARPFTAHILAHEIFHAWNVKRIHSNKLGPFDYTQPVKTTSIWLSEGVTDYYAHTLLARSRTTPSQDFYQKMTQLANISHHSHTPKSLSLEQLSLEQSNFNLNNALTFYYKGTLVGLMLDIEIRTQTNNAKSLDDAMKGLYAEAKKNESFRDEDLLSKIESFTGTSLQEFYRKFIAGNEPLALEEYFEKMGVELLVLPGADGEPNTGDRRLKPLYNPTPLQLAIRTAIVGS